MPPGSPGAPSEMQLQSYSNAPASAAFVAFGSLGVVGGKLVVNGYLFDTKNLQYPQVIAKQYSEDPTDDSARQIAHRFADEIILRLGGGIPGIAETKIYYVKMSGEGTNPVKEIWEMDYDGANQHPITHLGTISISPAHLARQLPPRLRLARQVRLPDQDVLAPARPLRQLPQRRRPAPNRPPGRPAATKSPTPPRPAATSTSGSPTPTAISRRRITNFTRRQRIAHLQPQDRCPDRLHQRPHRPAPALHHELRRLRVQQMTDGGYASSPSWSPNGQMIAFAWDRKYGPGAPGGQDIYVMEVATKKWWQLTHDGGRCDFPSWSPDGRHIVYANSADGRADHTRIWTMLADGTQRRPLTGPGADMPNWSWK